MELDSANLLPLGVCWNGDVCVRVHECVGRVAYIKVALYADVIYTTDGRDSSVFQPLSSQAVIK